MALNAMSFRARLNQGELFEVAGWPRDQSTIHVPGAIIFDSIKACGGDNILTVWCLIDIFPLFTTGRNGITSNANCSRTQPISLESRAHDARCRGGPNRLVIDQPHRVLTENDTGWFTTKVVIGRMSGSLAP